LIEKAQVAAEEYYFSFLLDRADRTFLSICSASGGMDIEEVAHATPEKVAKIPISPLEGVNRAKAREIVRAGGLPDAVLDAAAETITRLWEVFTERDATLVEVNPLAATADGRIVALDGKVTLDDNAAFRQPDHEALVDRGAEDPLE